MIYDFIINDSAIFGHEDKSFVRRNLSENEAFINFTLSFLANDDGSADS